MIDSFQIDKKEVNRDERKKLLTQCVMIHLISAEEFILAGWRIDQIVLATVDVFVWNGIAPDFLR